MDAKSIDQYILGLEETTVNFPFEKDLAVYKRADEMFALLDTSKQPLKLSLKCDPQLSKLLREKYTEVMPGHKLNKKDWNTIILTGELSEDEIIDLIRHSYELVTNS